MVCVAWTSPMTAVANSVLTAAQWNTHVRDNLLETAPAKATTGGRLIVTAGVNSIVERSIQIAEYNGAQETTTSTSATDLATPGPAVTITTGTSALVFWAVQIDNATVNAQSLVDFAVSGVSTRSANDATALRHTSATSSATVRAASMYYLTTLTAGTNTFTLKYWVGSGTGGFQRRMVCVVAL